MMYNNKLKKPLNQLKKFNLLNKMYPINNKI